LKLCLPVRLILTLLLLAGTAGLLSAQDMEKRISLDLQEQTLTEVIRQISRQGGILFSYSPLTLRADRRISVHVHDMPLSAVFERVFTANGIAYRFSEKQVILTPAAAPVPFSGKPHPSESIRFTISGHVREKASGDAVIGANVYDPASMQGTSTNAYGYFSLSLPRGTYRLVHSFVGYIPVTDSIVLHSDTVLNTELVVTPVNINSVEIRSGRSAMPGFQETPGETRFSAALLKQLPGFAGNTDVIKTLQNIPGIISFGDGSAFYYVRGGNSDQNLLLIDEAPIYNPSHLFGFFSALAPDAIKEVRVYKGDFPSDFGGRLSSVTDVHAREGNLKQSGFAGNFGPYTSDLTVEGPIRKDVSSFLLSFRRSNLNWLRIPDEDQTYKFNFYDLNGKVNLQPNANNRLYITVFTGSDRFERQSRASGSTFGISWKNVAGTFRWNHTLNRRMFMNTTASISRYRYYLYTEKELGNYWLSAITNATLKSDLSWYPNPENTVKAGLEFSSHRSDPGNYYNGTEDMPVVSTYQAAEVAAYLSNEQHILRNLTARYGLRLTRWNDLGPSTVYFFDANHQVIDTVSVARNTVYQSFLNLEPRLSLSWSPFKRLSVQASASHHVQHMQMLSNSGSPFTSLEVWVTSGPGIQPQKADQVSFGFTAEPARDMEFTAEVYYKKLYNQIEYRDHANMLFNPLLEGELRFGDGYARGLETQLRKTAGKLTGSISYAWTKAVKKIPEVNGGKEFPAAWDRPHNLNLTLSYVPERRWEFAAHWMYMTGAPFSSPTGFYSLNGYTVPVYGEKNNDRLPDYHRLDLSVNYILNKPESRYRHSVMLTVYNAYGRHNPFAVNFNKIMDVNGNFVVPTNLAGEVEQIPAAISVAGAIPSLNYIFRF
jgi:hypothetical protein